MFKSYFVVPLVGLSAVVLASTAYVATASAAPGGGGPKPAGDLVCEECVELEELEADSIDSSKIINGTILPEDLSFDPATQAELDAIDTVPLARVVYVSDGGVSATANGTDLLAAIDEIGNSGPCTTVTASLPCLVKIGPGVFDLGTDFLDMIEFVDIEGSGQTVTLIQGVPDPISTVVMATTGNAELRHLTVQNNISGTSSIESALTIVTTGSVFKVSHVTVNFTGTGNSLNIGISTGNVPIAVLTDVTVFATNSAAGQCRAIEAGGDVDLTLNHVTVTADSTCSVSFALLGAGSGTVNVAMNHSVLVSDDDAIATPNGGTGIYNFDVHTSQLTGGVDIDGGATVNLATSLLDGAVDVTGTGVLNCFSVYDATLTAHAC